MCTSPLKGFISPVDGHVLQVRKSEALGVRFDEHKCKWITIYDKEDLTDDTITKFIDMPCRGCLECYQQMRREWTTRAIAESKCHDKMMFLTLTYSDDKIPIAEFVDDDGVVLSHPTLKYRDFQLFMKRLRKCFDKPIRFMVCGEYGSHTFRPHYHAILFGIGLDDFSNVMLYSTGSRGDPLYNVSDIDSLWRKGYVTVSAANTATIGYVAGYVAKKSTTRGFSRDMRRIGVCPPFIRASNRPGLGRTWLDKNLDKFDTLYDYVSVPTDSEPFQIHLTSSWKRVYEDKVIYSKIIGDDGLPVDHNFDMIMEDKTEHFLNKQKRRQELFDNRFDNLDTDMSKDDYNSARNIDFRNSSKRKRGVY